MGPHGRRLDAATGSASDCAATPRRHPDHKRVMMEIMGKKASSPVQQKYLEKTRPNYYRLTPLGKAIAAGLRSDPRTPAAAAAPTPGKPAAEGRAPDRDALARRGALREGRALREQARVPPLAGQPRGTARLGRRGEVPGAQRHGYRRSIRSSGWKRSAPRSRPRFDWCNAQDTVYLTRGGNAGSPIHVSDLANVLDFLVSPDLPLPRSARPEEERGQAKEADSECRSLSPRVTWRAGSVSDRRMADGAFDKAALYVKHPEFRRWQDNPEEPRDWTWCCRFPGINRRRCVCRSGRTPGRDPRRDSGRASTGAPPKTLSTCTHGDNPENPIHVSDLAYVLDFLLH